MQVRRGIAAVKTEIKELCLTGITSAHLVVVATVSSLILAFTVTAVLVLRVLIVVLLELVDGDLGGRFNSIKFVQAPFQNCLLK